MCQLSISSAWDRQWIHQGCTMGPWTMHHRQPNNGPSIKSHIFESDLRDFGWQYFCFQWSQKFTQCNVQCREKSSADVRQQSNCWSLTPVEMINDITPWVCQSMTGRSVIAGQDGGWMTLADHSWSHVPSAWSISWYILSLQMRLSSSSLSFDFHSKGGLVND